MTLDQQIVLAIILDLFFGDPRWFPHPVRLVGKFAMALEMPFRRVIHSPRVAGVVVASLVVLATALCSGALVMGFRMIHPILGDAVSVLLLYSGIAARDMIDHSSAVYRALAEGSLPEARRRVGMICGRDTDRLDTPSTVRATVESVAENMIDGVTSPLFYAVLGGPVGIMAYKAVSTLDSTFGYKNDRYREFGWASARLDDVANFVPARLTAILVPVAAALLGLRPVESLRSFLRDRGKHPSPNAGQAEAAVAGAIGIQLGGLSYYAGQASEKALLGDPLTRVEPDHILQANRLLLVTSGLALLLFLGIAGAVAA